MSGRDALSRAPQDGSTNSASALFQPVDQTFSSAYVASIVNGIQGVKKG